MLFFASAAGASVNSTITVSSGVPVQAVWPDAETATNNASNRTRFIGEPPCQTNRRRFSRHHGQSWPKTPPQNSEWFGIPLDQRSCEKSRFCWTSVSYSPVAMTHETRASLAAHWPSMLEMFDTGQWK